MKESIERIILDAWRELAGSLWSDGRSLDRRFDRRRRGCRAVRGWSLAIRASDSRLGEAIAASPEQMEPDVVDLDPPAIRWLCGGASLTADRVNLRRAAAELGQSPKGLLTARVAGAFTTDYVRGLGGKWGKSHPLLSSDLVFDPSTRGLVPRDPLWLSALPGLLSRIPDDLPMKTLLRVPRYQKLRDHFADTRDLHPEHPRNDPPPRRRRKSLALPPPPPDNAWYKWKGDTYLGYDWRNPASREGYIREQRRLAAARDSAKRRRREDAPPSAAAGSVAFRGWNWICPACERRVHVLFLPIQPINLAGLLDPADPAQAYLVGEIARTPFPTPGVNRFACERCHRLRRYSHCDPNAWNDFVAWASGGLLYGRDVPRPQWLIPKRKLAYKPRPSRDPGVRIDQVERALLDGKNFHQIAAELKIARGTVLWHAQQVYKRHGVKTLGAFLTKNGVPAPISKREQVRQRVEKGQPVQQIAQEMNITPASVYNHVYVLKRDGLIAKPVLRTGAKYS